MKGRKYLVTGSTIILLLVVAATVVYTKAVSGVPQDGAQTTVQQYEGTRNLRFCEVFLIGGNAITRDLRAAVYNSTANFTGSNSLNTCPDEKVATLDLDAYKKKYKVLAAYFNKPRFWVFDRLRVPVGTTHEFNELNLAWMAEGIIPKDADVKKKGWLTYRPAAVVRTTEMTFFKNTPLFILDDPEGKPWVMKSYRDDHGQTYESLSQLGERYERLPEGWSFRVAVLSEDLVLKPTAGTATIMQDEFENTYDYLGDGSSNFLP